MLPNLPKQIKKREADFGIRLGHWLAKNPQHSCAYELKQTTGSSIPFDALEVQQIAYLKNINSGAGALLRIPGTRGEPDYVWLRNFPASVVIRFPREFSLISIETFLLEKRRSSRKSLTVQRAREISTVTVPLGRIGATV